MHKLTMTTGVVGATMFALCLTLLSGRRSQAIAGETIASDYTVLSPITHGSLTIFPVVAAKTHDTKMFITLDEGLRSSQVLITEWGQAAPLIRRQRPIPTPQIYGAQVNQLVLVNNSDRPLILLAGEIVTGGKQDRVVAKDRIVPPHGEPVELGVFCVEPGRWTGPTQSFSGLGKGTGSVGYLTQMAQPSVRSKAMADKDQRKVWDSVNESVTVIAGATPSAAPIHGTTSYARVMDNKAVKEQVDKIAAPVEQSYESVIRQLRAQNAVGVVVAIKGEIVWADVFASTPLLEKYWPKLVRSYAAESLTSRGQMGNTSIPAAQAFLNEMNGTREMVDTEPGVYRHTEIVGHGYRAFELASLLPKTGFDVHISKMAE